MLFPCPEFVKKLIEYLERFFAKLDHTHPDLAPTDHDHDSDYAPLDHDHDSDYAPLDHDHDDRYYTETETDTLLDDKADVGHTHQGGGAMVGEIRMWGGNSEPDGWLFCSGQTLSRSQYSELFSVIGEAFGPGDGSTTFELPLFWGRFPIGVKELNYYLGDTGGEKEHTLTEAEMPSHNHPIKYSVGTNGPHADAANVNLFYSNAGTKNSVIVSQGGGNPHNNLPPYLAVNFIIYAGA